MHHLAVGILGATVMPHSLFLGSALATQDRLALKSDEDISGPQDEIKDPHMPSRKSCLSSVCSAFASLFVIRVSHNTVEPKTHRARENNSLAFVKAHLYHGIADIVISLIGFAVLINSLYVVSPLIFRRFHDVVNRSSSAS